MKPEIHETSFIDKTAVIIGNVRIGKNCGIFPNSVIRGDQNSIEIEEGTNVQDCCIIHTSPEYPVRIGKNVSLGHGAIVHGATIEDECLVGMNSTILNGAKLKEGTVVGANAVVTSGTETPKNSLILGIPGKIAKKNKHFKEENRKNAEKYKKLSKKHKQGKYKRK